jgi:tetratricopeptide (TPR) repeat protein
VTKLALSIIEGQTTELGKAQALIDWVQLHVRPQTSAPTSVITDDYVNIIKRGWGYCDQMAHVFATMATYVGLDAKQLQLFKDNGESPHTLVMVKIDGKWRIASTWRGVIPLNAKGEPYTKTGFIHLLEQGDIYELAPIGASEFDNSKSFETFPYISNWQIGLKIVYRLLEKIRSRSSSLFFSSSLSDLEISTYIPESELEIYDRARDAHLDRNYELAQERYTQVISTSTSPILKNEARFASGMAAYDAKDYEAALKIFEGIIGSDKDSAWQISARRMKAESLIKLGSVKEALVVLDSIETPQSKVRATIIRSN